MPSMRGWLVLLAAAGCWTGSAPPAADPATIHVEAKPPTPRGPLEVTLAGKPLSMTMAERARFVIAFSVTNRTAAPLDPKLDAADLLINGEPSVMWANTNGNGGREPEWYALPPGEHVGREYQIGQTLFEKPGDYTLVLKVSGILSQPLHVHVSD